MNVIGVALEELYRIFNILNHDKFDDVLSEPVITIQKTRNSTLGHFTLDKVWRNKNKVGDEKAEIEADENDDNAFYEINIDPRWFYSRTPEEIVETLLHEMVHYSNKNSGIKDCSGKVHNKKFKVLAQSVGLIVEKGKTVGWGYTSISDELMEYIKENIKPNAEAFEYFRTGVVKTTKPKKKVLFKYICPKCGQVVKGKNGIAVKCANCDVIMKMEEGEFDTENDNH